MRIIYARSYKRLWDIHYTVLNRSIEAILDFRTKMTLSVHSKSGNPVFVRGITAWQEGFPVLDTNSLVFIIICLARSKLFRSFLLDFHLY